MSENANDKCKRVPALRGPKRVPALRGPRISCRLEVLPGERVLDRLNDAAKFGFDAVSLPGRFLNDYLDELRRCLSDSPLPLVSMSLGFSGSLLIPAKKAHNVGK